MLLARPDELRLASMLADLQQLAVFSVQQFEATVDSIRTCVAEVRHVILAGIFSLWHYMLVEVMEIGCGGF